MDLYDYFYKLKKETDITMEQFATMFDVSAAYISLLVNARRHPSFAMAQNIERKTNGKVKAIELLKKRLNPIVRPMNTKKGRKKKVHDGKFHGEQLELDL
jgi:transcriptional regulator with XRE-family HTH domain